MSLKTGDGVHIRIFTDMSWRCRRCTVVSYVQNNYTAAVEVRKSQKKNTNTQTNGSYVHTPYTQLTTIVTTQRRESMTTSSPTSIVVVAVVFFSRSDLKCFVWKRVSECGWVVARGGGWPDDATRVSRGVLCCPSNPTTTNNNRAQAVREIAGCCCAKMEAYQSELATDVAHGDAAWEENAGKTRSNIQEVRFTVSENQNNLKLVGSGFTTGSIQEGLSFLGLTWKCRCRLESAWIG